MKKFELFIPWLLVCIATVGSLFFSEWYNKEPCTLCWYQRIAIFPLVIILGIAAFRNAYRIILYVFPISLIGFAIATFHLIIVTFFSDSNLCPTCTLKGLPKEPISFSLYSFITFLLLNVLMIGIYWRHRKSKKL